VHEGISPRTGIFWAACRQLGSMTVSYALVLVPAVAVICYAESHVAVESALRKTLVVENVEHVKIDGVLLQGDKWVSPAPLLYVLYFAGVFLVWSPVLVNLARHFMRYQKAPQGSKAPCTHPHLRPSARHAPGSGIAAAQNHARLPARTTDISCREF
jgi:hypothetical protein